MLVVHDLEALVQAAFTKAVAVASLRDLDDCNCRVHVWQRGW